MNKLTAILELFKVGNSVANPVLWKTGQITTTVLASVILAVINLLAAFGYSIPIDIDTANALATFIIALVNVIFTFITSDKIGIKGKDSQNEAK